MNNDKGEEVPLEIGSYGICISRTIAGIVEVHHGENKYYLVRILWIHLKPP